MHYQNCIIKFKIYKDLKITLNYYFYYEEYYFRYKNTFLHLIYITEALCQARNILFSSLLQNILLQKT